MKQGVGYALSGLVAALGFVACSSGAGSTRGGGPVVLLDDPTDDSAPVSLTVVHLNADGTQDVTMRTITVGEEKAAKARRLAHQAAARGAAPAAAPRFRPEDNTPEQDPYCDDYTLWLYTGTNGTGGKMCLYAPGTGAAGTGMPAEVDLATTQYCVFYNGSYQCTYYAYWAGYVASFWPGQDNSEDGDEGASPGCLSNFNTYDNSSGYQQNFAVNGALTNTLDQAQTNYLWMNQTCCSSGIYTCQQYNDNNSCVTTQTVENQYCGSTTNSNCMDCLPMGSETVSVTPG